jgi:hypothetical protein
VIWMEREYHFCLGWCVTLVGEWGHTGENQGQFSVVRLQAWQSTSQCRGSHFKKVMSNNAGSARIEANYFPK